MVSLTPVNFDGHSHGGSGDIMFLICHKISQDHRTKKHPNIMSMSPLRLVTLLLSLTAMDTEVVEMYYF